VNDDLLALLEAHGHGISQKVLDDMYAADPFWTRRFGERGRRHANEDSDFHMQYLRRAVDANDPEVMVRYATWLRDVLVSRGMCSRHLAENFERLAQAIASHRWDGGRKAVAIVEEAARALAYRPDTDARRIQDLAVADEGRHLASYLADAVARANPALFVDHVRWLARELPGEGGATGLANALATLEASLARHAQLQEAATLVREARTQA
jgi:hypothetical protein